MLTVCACGKQLWSVLFLHFSKKYQRTQIIIKLFKKKISTNFYNYNLSKIVFEFKNAIIQRLLQAKTTAFTYVAQNVIRKFYQKKNQPDLSYHQITLTRISRKLFVGKFGSPLFYWNAKQLTEIPKK